MPLGMDRDLAREVQRMLQPLRNKIMSVARKATVHLVDDSKLKQELQVELLADEVMDEVEHMQPGGLTHNPPAKSTGVFLALNGYGDDGVVMCLARRGRRPLNLETGETCIYNDVEQQSRIILRANGDVEIIPANETKIGANATDMVALSSKVDAEIQRLWDLLTSWKVAPQDGGAALQLEATARAEAVQSVAATKTKAE